MQQESQNDINQPAPPQANTIPPSVAATAPGQLKIIKRNGMVVPFTEDKISVAMTKAFLAVEGGTAAASPRVRELVTNLTSQITETFHRRLPSGGTLHIEEVQDQVELFLMRTGEQQVARSYVLYREQRAAERAVDGNNSPSSNETGIKVIDQDGTEQELDINRIRVLVTEACEGLGDVDPEKIISESLTNMYDGISSDDVATSILITARTLVEEEPNYTYVTARLLLDELRTEALTYLNVDGSGSRQRATQGEMSKVYPSALKAFIKTGIELGLVAPELAEFDLDLLGEAIHPERDMLLSLIHI